MNLAERHPSGGPATAAAPPAPPTPEPAVPRDPRISPAALLVVVPLIAATGCIERVEFTG